MRGMNIQRPIIVTEKQKMYGDVFTTTQGHQHMYECVQPLQGVVTFTEPRENDKDHQFYHNNLSAQGKDRPTRTSTSLYSMDSIIYVMLVVKMILGGIMLGEIEIQTRYNDIYLTYFKASDNHSTYSVEGAGMTNPLYCMLIALSLVSFSVIIGLTQAKKYMLGMCESIILVIALFVLQGMAIALHILMLTKTKPDQGYYCLTTVSMLVLHALTCILSFLGLGLLLAAPQSTQAKKNDPKIALMHRVTMINGVAHIKEKQTHEEFVEVKRNFEALPWKPLTYEDIHGETTGNFWMCVVEDLNTILCYAFVVRACDAQSSIHDDSTTFFDVMCIVFLGFLQHVANILMIFHSHAEKRTLLEMKPKKIDEQEEMQDQIDQLMHFIARTRMLLFFMISCTLLFFVFRVAPTYEEFSSAKAYIALRWIAVFTMFFLNTFYSAWFEIQNRINERRQAWDTSPTWKLGALSFIALVSCIMLFIDTRVDQNVDTRHLLHQLTVRTTPPPSATSTPAPAK